MSGKLYALSSGPGAADLITVRVTGQDQVGPLTGERRHDARVGRVRNAQA